MRFKRLDLNLVVVLDALLAERSVTKAGQRLHASQTTISDALRRLREYFNDELLIQVGRKMVPTPLGESLIMPARSMLLQAEAMLNTTPSFDPSGARRTFTLMVSDYISTVLISNVVATLARTAPQVTLEVLGHSQTPWESLQRGDTDFLIMPEEYLSTDHPHEPLFTDEFCCVAWRGNVEVGETITLEQFMQMGHVVARFGHNRTPSVDEWFFRQYGNQRRIETYTTGFFSVPQMIIGTNRIATLQRTLVEYYSLHLPIRLLRHDFELPTLSESLQWNRFADTDPGMVWMRSVLREHSAAITTRQTAAADHVWPVAMLA
jgi:LysR family nod box-dependent transcriptional activator